MNAFGPGLLMNMRRLASITLNVSLAVACDDGDAEPSGSASSEFDPSTVVVATSTPAPMTDAATSTTQSTTTSTTVTVPTTVPSTDALEAEIAADYERTFYEQYEMLRAPSLDDLDARVAAVLVPGSPVVATFTERIRELVGLGDAVVPNDPDILSVTVEDVELVGAAPYEEALVTVCEADNRKQVTPPENSPNGMETETLGTGDLLAIRLVQVVRRTAAGWLLYQTPTDGVTAYLGTDTCPPE